jgi:phosphate starvation-inducible protein PhoH
MPHQLTVEQEREIIRLFNQGFPESEIAYDLDVDKRAVDEVVMEFASTVHAHAKQFYKVIFCGKSPNQKTYRRSFLVKEVGFGRGPAGTGKSWLGSGLEWRGGGWGKVGRGGGGGRG